MFSRQWAFGITCGLTVMTVIGCYSHYPSSVYGPGYPGGYAVPPAGASPQGGYVVPGSPGGGPTLAPGGSYQYQSPSSSRWQPGGGGDAPAYIPPSDAGGNDKPVPNYNDLPGDGGSSRPQFQDQGDYGDDNDFGGAAPASAAPAGSGGGTSPFGPAADSSDESPFVAPEVSLTPVSAVRPAADSAPATPAAAPNPYKYDRENFRWLRGVVDYDGEAQSWNIIYSIEPEPQDEFGGSIVLLAGDQLESLQENDVVLVEGEVDADQLDDFGKPMFRVDRLVALQPAE